MKSSIFLTVLILLLTACSKEKISSTKLNYAIGKNWLSIEVNGKQRAFLVHLPSNYTDVTPIPVVFMLHGSSGSGEKFYNISGWKEVGEKSGVLTVFPTAETYCIEDEGKRKYTTKWTVPNRNWTYCDGHEPQDDILFLRTVLQRLKRSFAVDERRCYLAGFSNGGKMAAHAAVEMSDLFAAVAQNSGAITPDTVFYPQRPINLLLQYGNQEDRLVELNGGSPFPLNQFDGLLTNYPEFTSTLATYLATYHLDQQFSLSGDVNRVVTATYRPIDPAASHEFQVRLVNQMGHLYPNGNNHPLIAAEEQWKWFKKFQLD